MIEQSSLPELSRRQFIGASTAAAGIAVCGIGATQFAGQFAGWLDPVVSFHADAPYLDRTGLAEPFQPRIATDWALGLDHEAVLRLGHTL